MKKHYQQEEIGAYDILEYHIMPEYQGINQGIQTISAEIQNLKSIKENGPAVFDVETTKESIHDEIKDAFANNTLNVSVKLSSETTGKIEQLIALGEKFRPRRPVISITKDNYKAASFCIVVLLFLVFFIVGIYTNIVRDYAKEYYEIALSKNVSSPGEYYHTASIMLKNGEKKALKEMIEAERSEAKIYRAYADSLSRFVGASYVTCVKKDLRHIEVRARNEDKETDYVAIFLPDGKIFSSEDTKVLESKDPYYLLGDRMKYSWKQHRDSYHK